MQPFLLEAAFYLKNMFINFFVPDSLPVESSGLNDETKICTSVLISIGLLSLIAACGLRAVWALVRGVRLVADATVSEMKGECVTLRQVI
jgi:hypothetical protein